LFDCKRYDNNNNNSNNNDDDDDDNENYNKTIMQSTRVL